MGDLLVVFFPQKISDIAVVVVSYRYVGVLYHMLLALELCENALFNAFANPSRFGFSSIPD